MSEAYSKGYEIGRNGGSAARCPYLLRGKLRDDWMNGFETGLKHHNFWTGRSL